MRAFLLCLLFAISSLSFGASPYAPWVDDLLDDARFFKTRLVKGNYDYSVVGGSTGTYNLTGAKIPANSIITRSYFVVSAAVADGGAGTVSVGCESTVDIYAAADITGNSTGDVVAGIQDDAVANFTTIESGCVPTVTLDGAAVTAGELDVYFEYILTD